MRIVTWNCNGAFGKKSHLVNALHPDLAIVSECTRADVDQAALFPDAPTSADWIGNNSSKGLAVFAYGAYTLERADFYDPRFKLILPLWVRGEKEFLLIAIWTLQDGDSYIRALASAVERWSRILERESVVLAGDFNASFAFDKPRRQYKFTDIVAALGAGGVSSVYHLLRGEEHGRESEKTFYQYRHETKAHHIDYIFASTALARSATSLSVGSFHEWAAHSDHMPLVASFGG